jgi:Tol biopolymer transport system component
MRRLTILLVLVGGLLTPPVVGAQSVTTRVSVDAGGGDADGRSASPSVSTDGRLVAFSSQASDIAGGGPTFDDVFLRDRAAATTRLVNVDTPVAAGNPAVSDDGRYVAYAARLGTPDGPTHVLVRDVVAATTTPVDFALGDTPPNGDALGQVSISGDGRHVAFTSFASNLVADDGNGQPDVFVRDLDAGRTVRANVDTAGGDSGFADFGGRLFPDSPDVLSADGRYVAFESAASDLVAGDDDGGQHDIFVRDLVAGVTRLVSDGPRTAVVLNPAISSDGRRVAYLNLQFGFLRGGDVLVRDLGTGGTVQANIATGDPTSFSFSTPSLSADGRYVAFDSTPVNRDAGDNTPVDSNVFVRDLDAGTTTRVSVDRAGGAPDGSSFDPAISAGGRSVAYVSGARDLVAADGNGLRDVFVADLGPRDARAELVALGRFIEALGLPKGTETGFTAKVRSAVAALERRATAAACGELGALLNHARAQRGKHVTTAQADEIIARSSGIRATLGCP